MSSIKISHLSVGYPRRPVLSDLSLDVQTGSRTAVLGASGDGKTTLLRAIAGFLRPSHGTIEVSGRLLSSPSRHVPPEQRDIGYVRQDGALFPHLDVAGNIAFGLRRNRARPQAVCDLLELVGLDPALAKRRPDQLSGGQQQRVALARALARRPQLVLLDEPFSSLDASLRAATRSATADALTERDATAILVTHDQAEALSFADQVAVLVGGRVRQTGSPREVYEFPVDLAVARLLGDVVVLDANVAAGVLNYAGGRFPAPGLADGPARVVFRPEQLRLVDLGASPLRGTVHQVRYHGADAVVDVQLESGQIVQSKTGGLDTPPSGTDIGITITGPVRAATLDPTRARDDAAQPDPRQGQPPRLVQDRLDPPTDPLSLVCLPR